MNNMDAKLKHLEMIQIIINRMASNSFVFKGWSITIVAGLTSFAAADTNSFVMLVSFIATILFWMVDAYYLMLERAFRDLYKIVAKKEPDDIDFLMKAPGISFGDWLKTLFTRPILIGFYTIALTLISASFYFIFYLGGLK